MPGQVSKTKTNIEKPKSEKKSKTKVELTIPLYDMNGIKKSDLEVPKEAFNEKENPNLLAQYFLLVASLFPSLSPHEKE